MDILQKAEEGTNFLIEIPIQKSYYFGYHYYPLNYIVNSNIDIFPIQHMAKIKINITTTKSIYYNFIFHIYAILICIYMNK